MSINAQIIDQRIRKLMQENRLVFTEQIGLSNDEHKLISATFVFLSLKSIIDISDEEAMDAITDGGNDFGVDALYCGPQIDGEISITLVQGKYIKDIEKNPHFPQSGVEKIIQAVRHLFDPSVTLTLNKRLFQKVEEIRSLISEGIMPTVHVILCNNGQKWTDDSQTLIDEARFGDQVTWQHVGPDFLVELLRATKPVNDTVTLTGQAVVEDFPGFRRVLIGRMGVGQLASLFDRHHDRLLERNIRRYLGLSGNRVNEAIQETLKDDEQRENFYFYNNGITIICSQFRINQLQKDNRQVRLEGLQIVNGGQTSKTVQQVVKDCPKAAEAQILVRIYELPDEEKDIVLNITQATNSQNPVDLRDLRSNDLRQKGLAQAISDLGYNYRRQRGDTSSSSKDISSASKDLTSATVAESVLAVWRQRPHQARFNAADHFGKLYDIIFKEDLNGAQAIVASLLQRIAENKRKRPPANAPDFLPYASRFIAMMMGKYLLDDMKIELTKLTHANFPDAENLVERKGDDWFAMAVAEIDSALEPFRRSLGDMTLQRLSAQFRRADLIQQLLKGPLTAQDGVAKADP